MRSASAANLETGTLEKLGEGGHAVYSPSGHIIYQTSPVERGLWALPFSIDTLSVTGEAFPIAEGLGQPSVSEDGMLVAIDVITQGEQQLIWRDREGRRLGSIGQAQFAMSHPALSPDGRWVAVSSSDSRDNRVGTDIWLHSVDRPVKQRLTARIFILTSTC
jgi:hypothetical protein